MVEIRNPTPSVLSDSDDSDDESDGDSAEFAGAAHDSDPRSLKAALQCSDGNRWQEAAKLKMDNHISNGYGSSLIYLLMQNALILDGFSVLNEMQMVPLSDTRLVSLLTATVNVLALITLKYLLLPSNIQLSTPLLRLQL